MPTEALDDFGGLSTTVTAVLLEPGDATKAEFCELNDGVLETSLGRKELFAGVIASATIKESFNKADGALGPNLTWTNLIGADWAVVSNEAAINGTGGANEVRADVDVSTNHRVGAILRAVPTGTTGSKAVGVIARKDSSATRTYYYFGYQKGAGAVFARLSKVVAGVETALASDVVETPAVGDLIELECNGSTISAFRNGAQKFSVTDTSITTGTRGGMGRFVDSADVVLKLDDWFIKSVGDIAVTTIIDWRRLDGSSFVLVFTTADILKVDFSLKTFVSIKPVAYTITGTRAWSWVYATLADKIVFTNGEDAPLEWDGVAAEAVLFTLPAGVTKPKFMLWWKNRLHLFGTTDSGASKPYRHWWSELFIYNAWLSANGAGFLDYSTGGEPINAVAGLENLVLLLKQTRATVIAATGVATVPFASRDMETIKGTYAPFSVQVTSIGVFYLAVDGLRLFDGSSSRLVSEHVDAFSNIPITALTLTSSVLDSVFKRYLVAIPSVVGGENDRVWNVLYQFYPEDRMEFSVRPYAAGSTIRSLSRFIRSEQFTWQSFPNDATGQWDVQTITWTDPKTSGEFDELVAGGYAGQVWLFEDQPSDLGAVIPLVWETGVLPPKVSRQLTRLRWLSVSGVQAINSTITVDVLDADTEEVRFSALIDFSTKRATVVHPNRSFPGGFILRLRNTQIGSIPAIDQLRYEYLPGKEGRQ